MTQNPDSSRTSTRPSRRTVLTLAGASAAVVAGGYLFGQQQWSTPAPDVLDAPTASAALDAGTLALIDVRRPDEWELTGVPRGAIPIDMRRPDFLDAVADAVGGDRAAPLAVICARGVRSARMRFRMLEAGFTNVRDVSEGMLGSAVGPGWLARGLPVVAHAAS